jgi:hypothetical protein
MIYQFKNVNNCNNSRRRSKRNSNQQQAHGDNRLPLPQAMAMPGEPLQTHNGARHNRLQQQLPNQ